MCHHRSHQIKRLMSVVALATSAVATACGDPVAPAPAASVSPPNEPAALTNSNLFYNVTLGGQEGLFINVYFQYSGNQMPIVEAGLNWVTAKKLSNGYWIARSLRSQGVQMSANTSSTLPSGSRKNSVR